MTTAKQHDDPLLGAHYTWSVAGVGDPFERGAAWLTRHGLADFTRHGLADFTISVTDIVTTAGPDRAQRLPQAPPRARHHRHWAATAGLTLAHSATDQGLQIQVFRRAT
jgi:hypothetical protein